MNTCETCKFWQKPSDYSGVGKLGLRHCTAALMFWDSTQWDEDGEKRTFMPAAESTTAFVQDGSDYHASLYTRPTHGCTMHEAA